MYARVLYLLLCLVALSTLLCLTLKMLKHEFLYTIIIHKYEPRGESKGFLVPLNAETDRTIAPLHLGSLHTIWTILPISQEKIWLDLY